MRLTIDFETRSTVDLKKQGLYRYAEDPSTEVLCLAVKVENFAPVLWVPEKFWPLITGSDLAGFYRDDDWLAVTMDRATEVHAHNATFEIALWHYFMHLRLGFDNPPLEVWRDTAAKAAYSNIPRHLDGACQAMGLPAKDKAGHAMMLKMCKPRKPVKAERIANPDWENTVYWNETPEQFQANARYCLNDVEIEYALDKMLMDPPEKELELWRLDYRANREGVYIDVDEVQGIHNAVEERVKNLNRELRALTLGRVNKGSEVAKSLAWLQSQGAAVSDVQLGTLLDLKATGLPPHIQRFVDIRIAFSKVTSCAKYAAMLRCACSDSHIRGMLQYYGAQATGRWTGKLVQLQNLPRGGLEYAEMERAIWALSNLGIAPNGGDVIATASSCVRGVLQAEPGFIFRCADFSNIEGRIQSWFAGEAWKVQAFRDYDNKVGPDLYKLAFSRSFNVPVENVDKEQRQVGKVQELALGFGGGISAFASMAENYSLNLEALVDLVLPRATKEQWEKAEWTADKYFENQRRYNKEIIMSTYAAMACDVLKQLWRLAHPAIVSFWATVEAAAIRTVKEGTPYRAGLLMFGMKDNFLHMRLPSGRLLAMYNPKIVPGDFGGEQLTFWGINSKTYKWSCKRTYGGDLFQSGVQATARDVMAEAMLRTEARGYPTAFSVHDEIVAKSRAGEGTLAEFENLMSVCPEWAEGLPVSVEGWEGTRYRK